MTDAEDPPPLPVVDAVTDYEKIERIGEGTFGIVYKARQCSTGEIVALKKARLDRERDGMPVTCVRELRVLQACHHPNLINLRRVVTGSSPDSIFLVLDYCEHDMGRLLDAMPLPFTLMQVKCIMLQVLEAVACLHDHWVQHRDLKLSNLLLNNSGVVRVCDFGLARFFRPYVDEYTPRVVTLWYRAPEVLLGATDYTEAIDMWALGCILGEFLKHEPLFPGKTEQEMLHMIATLLGTPSTTIWPGLRSMPFAASVAWPDQPYNFIKKHFPSLSVAGVDLLNRLLMYDPSRRISARQALRHEFFREHPYPCTSGDLARAVAAQHYAPKGGGRGRRGRDAQDEQRAEQHRRIRDERFGDVFAI